MKKYIFIIILVAISVAYAATRDFTPRADGEGSIGTSSKNWGASYIETGTFDDVTVNGNITVTGTVDSTDVAALKTDVDGFPDELKDLVTAEIQQLENIGAATVSAAQWGYLGGLDQTVSSSSSVDFSQVTADYFIADSTLKLHLGQGGEYLIMTADNGDWGGADRTLTLDIDANRRLEITGDSYLNQDVRTTASPTFAGLTISAFVDRSITAGITATNPGAQGDSPLTTEINEVSTVGTADDAVTLPAAVAGRKVIIINNGANQLEIWPASGDNAGGGVDTAVTLAAGSNVQYVAYDATNWESI